MHVLLVAWFSDCLISGFMDAGIIPFGIGGCLVNVKPRVYTHAAMVYIVRPAGISTLHIAIATV